MKAAALDYIARGFAVFPLQPRRKEPYEGKGFYDAVNEPVGVELMWAGRSGANIGLRTGEPSGVFVLDIDGPEGEAALGALQAQHGELPQTLESSTGKGRHLLFRWPGHAIKCSQSKVGYKIDVRGDGGYIVLPPSIHPSGRTYQWRNESSSIASAPAWLIDLATRERIKPAITILSHDSRGNWSDTDAREMLSYLSPDMQYDEWLRIGMALHQGGHSHAIWEAWSRTGQKYTPGCTAKRWTGFSAKDGITMGTLVDMARSYGWKPPQHERIIDESKLIDPTALMESYDRPKLHVIQLPAVIEAAPARNILGFDPCEMDGLIGETVRWIVGSAIYPQPELALLNTIAALGAVFGRRYASPLDTRTNVYIVGIAETGGGKDHSRKQIKNLMGSAGLLRFKGGDSIVSGAGVLQGLNVKPSHVLHLDEFGKLLQAITDQRGAAHMRAAGKIITELYSSSSSVYDGGSYADAKRSPVIIHSPNLCLYGTSTLGTYVRALTKEAIESGELNRFMVFPISDEWPTPVRDVASPKVPQALSDGWKRLNDSPQTGLGSADAAMIEVDPLLVPWPGLADRLYDMLLFQDTMRKGYAKDGTGSLWNRYRENVIKVAMILAIVRDPMAPAIVGDDLDIAERMVRASVEYMQTVAMDHMADSQHERDCQDVLQRLRGAVDGSMSRSDLFRALKRLDKKTLEGVITSLLEHESIECFKRPTAGRDLTIYKIV